MVVCQGPQAEDGQACSAIVTSHEDPSAEFQGERIVVEVLRPRKRHVAVEPDLCFMKRDPVIYLRLLFEFSVRIRPVLKLPFRDKQIVVETRVENRRELAPGTRNPLR